MEPDRPLDEVLAPLAERVWWIPGNHDADRIIDIERTWHSGLRDRNLHGRVVRIPDGRKIAGLGNVFRGNVWMPKGPNGAAGATPNFSSMRQHARSTPRQDRYQDGPHFKHWGTIYPEDFERLKRQRADLLVTHEASGYHPYGFSILDELARALGVSLLAHGHLHDARWRFEDQSQMWRAQGFKSVGVGLRGITAVKGNGELEVVIPGELDETSEPRTSRACATAHLGGEKP
ncbi:metallophosphoesterase family protein [Roseateles chitinivorans]|uniref:metallophosphoesterase family protein n=1 Tax=Roseateles chitinivorans TaxID=2917965 RepID=UPI003D67CF36